MKIVLSPDDLAQFSLSTRNEILRRFADLVGGMPVSSPAPAPAWLDQFSDVHISNLEDITYKQIHKWMEGASDTVRNGVRIIAEDGPLIEARLIIEAGINIRQFQSATTRRTRKITGDASAYFLAWNHWDGMDDPHAKYAVSPITHQSLRRYFGLPV